MGTTAGHTPLRGRPARQALEEHHERIRGLHLRELFADVPQRGTRMTGEAEGVFLDYSKNRATDQTLRLLGERPGLRERIDAMLAASTSTSPRTGLSWTSPCGRRRAGRSWSTVPPSSLRSREDVREEGTPDQLVVRYEHSVFPNRAVWTINPFDRWSAELDKALTTKIAELRADAPQLGPESSTNALIERYRAAARGRSA